MVSRDLEDDLSRLAAPDDAHRVREPRFASRVDVQRFLDSLAAFATLPPDTLVLPSHGMPFRGIGARVAQLGAHHAERLAELQRWLAAARVPQSAQDVIPVLFRRELDVHQRFFAMGEEIAHLNHLWLRGSAERRIAGDGTIRFTA